MYAIVPTNEPVGTIERDLKNTNSIVDTGDNQFDNITRNSYWEDSGFDGLFESEATCTEKTGLLSEISDSSSLDAEQQDKDKNYLDYAETLTNIRKEVDKKAICKKKKVRINEDITDISLIPDRFESCVNYKNGYNEYKQDKHTDRQKDSRNNRGKCYRYCFDTQNSGQHYYTAKWEEDNDILEHYRLIDILKHYIILYIVISISIFKRKIRSRHIRIWSTMNPDTFLIFRTILRTYFK